MKPLDPTKLPDTITPGEPFVEAVFEIDKKYLVFSTSEDAHEPTLCIQLFNSNGGEIEKTELYKAYTSGEFKINSVDGNRIGFLFWSNALIKLDYSEKPKWKFISPLGVHCANKLTRKHLKITEGK